MNIFNIGPTLLIEREGGVTKKSTLCALLVMVTILDDFKKFCSRNVFFTYYSRIMSYHRVFMRVDSAVELEMVHHLEGW